MYNYTCIQNIVHNNAYIIISILINIFAQNLECFTSRSLLSMLHLLTSQFNLYNSHEPEVTLNTRFYSEHRRPERHPYQVRSAECKQCFDSRQCGPEILPQPACAVGSHHWFPLLPKSKTAPQEDTDIHRDPPC